MSTSNKGGSASQQHDLVPQILAILSQTAPARVYPTRMPDYEYQPVAWNLSERLADAQSAAELTDMLYEQCEVWLTIGAGSKSNYEEAGRQIWTLWVDSQKKSTAKK